ncbi:rhomboid-like protein, partial [Streptomyces poriferorum]
DVGHFTAALIGLACYPLTRTSPETKPAPAK